jgi:hypothetical protein
MKSREYLKNHKPHDTILTGHNVSYLAIGYYPKQALEKILPRTMSIPSDRTMAEKFPTVGPVADMHPFLLMFSKCYNVHDVMTEIELRTYKELMFYFPVTVTHGEETQLCSYVPILYLDYLIGVIGGLYLGLRKQFHPRMVEEDTDTSRSYMMKNILDVNFQQTSTDGGQELDPFFVEIFNNPTTTVSYFGRTFFYTTNLYPTRVLNATSEYEWNYKGSVIRNDEKTIANYMECDWTTSHAMRYQAYFHPKYVIKPAQRPEPKILPS